MWTKTLYHNMPLPFIAHWLQSRQKCWCTSSKCKSQHQFESWFMWVWALLYELWKLSNPRIWFRKRGEVSALLSMILRANKQWQLEWHKIHPVNVKITCILGEKKQTHWFLTIIAGAISERNFKWKTCCGWFIFLSTRTTTLSSTSCPRQSIVLQVK